jgi:uncharacterized membrane protein YfcA
MEWAVLALVAFAAAFIQSLTGFGSALVAMAVLPTLLGIRTAAPLVALLAGTLEAVLLVRYRGAVNLRAAWPLLAASALGIPVGVLALAHIEERVVLIVLGVVIAGYALYALLNPRLPRLDHPAWAGAFGFVAGVLGGAYNTSGPPVVVYASTRGWAPDEFKGTLQGFFLVNDGLVILGHLLGHNLTLQVARFYAIALPALLLGAFLGARLDRYLNPAVFRKVVLALLLVVGLRLLW